MSGDLKAYTLGYRRAVHTSSDNVGRSLEEDFRRAHDRSTSAADRSIHVTSDDILECRHYRDEPRVGIFVHLVAYGPGSHADVVIHDPSNPAAPIGTTPPPANSDFMDANAAYLIRQNHVVYCGRGMRDGRLRSYAAAMFDRAGLPTLAHQFELRKIADASKLALINRERVKSVGINSTVYAATLSHLSRTERAAATGSRSLSDIVPLLSDLATAFSRGREVTFDAPDPDNLHVNLSINFSSRDGGIIAEHTIKEIAEQFVDDEPDGFYVETISGNKIKSDEIIIKRKTRISQQAKSFNYVDAWTKLQSFMNELIENGSLEA